jgi:tRNA-dihydrouridine synthase A
MLDWTDRHCRYFYRVMSQHTVLYTEMVTTGAILFGKGDYLGFNEEEHPLVLQLGGSDPVAMAKCAKLASERGYDEININVGCPSDRVQNGMFGACLMAQPMLVTNSIAEMKAVTDIPITVKSRIGIDDLDSYEFLHRFIDQVSQAGCDHFIIHARKAWLSGLSPKQNREVPPLDYERVYQIKKDFNQLKISINGGIKTFEQANHHLESVDGVMIGREIYQNPYMLAAADNDIFKKNTAVLTKQDIIDHMALYIDKHVASGGRAWHVLRHMLGLCNGLAGARKFRRDLSDSASKGVSNGDTLKQAYEGVVLLNQNANS